MPDSHRAQYRWIYLLLGTAFCVYVAARAALLSFTHDECLSYRYLHYSVGQILSNNTGGDLSANNHILNTLAMKFFHALAGPGELVLRLQSVLALIVYLFYSYRLMRLVKAGFIGLCGFVLLAASPYLLDFFSLARGYAPACAFMLMSLYHFIRFAQTGHSRQLAYSCIAMCIAILANFALILFCSALLIVFVARKAVHIARRKMSLAAACNTAYPALLPIFTMLWAYLVPLKALFRGNQLGFGSSAGFWQDTVRSLISTWLYEMPYSANALVALEVFAGFCCVFFPVAALALIVSRRHSLLKAWHLVVLLALAVTCGLSIVQHLALGTAYLQERFAVFLFPLFILSFIAAADIAASARRGKGVSVARSALLAGAALFHFSRAANLSYTLNWRYDADTKKMLTDLESFVRADGRTKIKFGPYWYFEPAVNFYREVNHLYWFEPVNWSWPDEEYDYHYISEEEYARRTDMNGRKIVSKKVLVRYPVSRNVLCLIETAK